MLLAQDHHRVGHDADDDRRNSVEHIRDKPDGVSKPVSPIFREVDAGSDSERHAQQARDRQDQDRTRQSHLPYPRPIHPEVSEFA